MNTLSIKQLQLLEAIEYFINQNGYSPTYEEIAQMLKCKKQSIFKRVMLLEEKGYIKTEYSKARSIRVIRND